MREKSQPSYPKIVCHDLRSSIIKSRKILAHRGTCPIVPSGSCTPIWERIVRVLSIWITPAQSMREPKRFIPRYTKLDLDPEVWSLCHLLLISTEVYTASGNKPQMKAIVRTKPNLALVPCKPKTHLQNTTNSLRDQENWTRECLLLLQFLVQKRLLEAWLLDTTDCQEVPRSCQNHWHHSHASKTLYLSRFTWPAFE